jgi:hypothetical protein
MSNEPKVKMVCAACGSDDVRRDAYAVWSVPNQAWELLTTFDNTDCEKCGGECSVTAEPVE